MKLFSKGYILIGLLVFALQPMNAKAQSGGQKDKKLIQLSGVVTSNLSTPVPFATVRIKNTYRGTIAGVDGFYSLVVGEKDTVVYEAIGHKKVQFIVPQGNADQKLTHNITMQTDTIVFEETVVYPWPTKEEFKEAFLSLKTNDTYADIAKRNMDQAKLQELYETLARDGQENQLFTLQQIANSYYYAGGQRNYMMVGGGVPIPTSLMNPFAWTQFIKDIRDGNFKKKKQ